MANFDDSLFKNIRLILRFMLILPFPILWLLLMQKWIYSCALNFFTSSKQWILSNSLNLFKHPINRLNDQVVSISREKDWSDRQNETDEKCPANADYSFYLCINLLLVCHFKKQSVVSFFLLVHIFIKSQVYNVGFLLKNRVTWNI